MIVMLCPACNKEYEESDRFCIACGKPLVPNDAVQSVKEDDVVKEVKTADIVDENAISNDVKSDENIVADDVKTTDKVDEKDVVNAKSDDIADKKTTAQDDKALDMADEKTVANDIETTDIADEKVVIDTKTDDITDKIVVIEDTKTDEAPVDETPAIIIGDIEEKIDEDLELEQRNNITHITNDIIIDNIAIDDIVLGDIALGDTATDDVVLNETENINAVETVPLTVKSNNEPFFARLGVGVVSFLTSILMLSFLIIATGSYIGLLLTDKNNIEQFVNQVDLLSLPANGIIATSNDDETLLDAIYTMSQGTGLTKEAIQTVYESSNIKEFLSDNLTDYADYIRTGDNPYNLSPEAIKKIYNDNLPLIYNITGKVINEHDISLAHNEIDKMSPTLDVVSAKGAASGFIAPIRVYISLPVFVIELSLFVFMIILIFMINKKASRSLRWCGIPIAVWGLAVLVTTFLIRMRVILTNVGSGFASSTIYDVFKVISNNLYITGASLVVLGIGCVIVSTLTKRKKNS